MLGSLASCLYVHNINIYIYVYIASCNISRQASFQWEYESKLYQQLDLNCKWDLEVWRLVDEPFPIVDVLPLVVPIRKDSEACRLWPPVLAVAAGKTSKKKPKALAIEDAVPPGLD